MSLRTAQHQLKDASKNLDLKWRALRETWNDGAARAFEREAIAPIDPAVRHAISAMARLSEILQKARSECE
ncbi:MAG: hypothetical protein AAGH64_03805 [Planctomycetota bacterium]